MLCKQAVKANSDSTVGFPHPFTDQTIDAAKHSRQVFIVMDATKICKTNSFLVQLLHSFNILFKKTCEKNEKISS